MVHPISLRRSHKLWKFMRDVLVASPRSRMTSRTKEPKMSAMFLKIGDDVWFSNLIVTDTYNVYGERSRCPYSTNFILMLSLDKHGLSSTGDVRGW